MRDVLEVQRERVVMTLRFDQPVLASMEPDRRAIEDRYLDQDPIRVAEQLEGAAASLASLLTELSETDWRRVATYNWPQPAERDVAWIGRQTVHELAHHLLDISRSIDPAVGPASG